VSPSGSTSPAVEPVGQIGLEHAAQAAVSGGEQLLRDFSLGSAFALAFAFISPIVALYSIFPLGIVQVGSTFWLGFPVALAGQLLVGAVFAMLVSLFPYEGSIYQWSRLLVGPRYGWFAGWIYIWALSSTMATVAIGAAGFVVDLFGVADRNPIRMTLIALALIVIATLGNTLGRTILKRAVFVCISAEIIGSLGVGTLLLLSRSSHGAHALIATSAAAPGGASSGGAPGFFNWPFTLAVALCGWAFLGFESAGAIAEEVKDAKRTAPRAILLSLLCVGLIVIYSAFTLVTSAPGGTVPASAADDPIGFILTQYLPRPAFKAVLVVFLTAFLACMLGIQATVSRVVWAYGRAGDLPFSMWLQRLNGTDRLPVNATVSIGIAAAAFCLLGLTNLYATILAFATAGFYIAFAFPLLAVSWWHARGRWQRPPFNLGPLNAPIIYLAAAWICFETINISWPRSPQSPWYYNYAVPLMTVLLTLVGLVVRGCLSKTAARSARTVEARTQR
jgi:amino acid transporter